MKCQVELCPMDQHTQRIRIFKMKPQDKEKLFGAQTVQSDGIFKALPINDADLESGETYEIRAKLTLSDGSEVYTNTTTFDTPEIPPVRTTTDGLPNDNWAITSRRSELAKTPATYFTFTPKTEQNKFITDVELEYQTVNQDVADGDPWVRKPVQVKKGNVPSPLDPNPFKIQNVDTTNLSVGMKVRGVSIPADAIITNISDTGVGEDITLSVPVTTGDGATGVELIFEEFIPPKKVKFGDLKYIDYTPGDVLPSTCSTSASCSFNKVQNCRVSVGGDQNNMTLSAVAGRLYIQEVNWGVSLRQRVIRLKSVQGINEEGQPAGVLVDVPTSRTWSHQVFMGHDLCTGDAYDNDRPTSAGEADIPPDGFEGGQMNATNSSASMTKANPYGDGNDATTTTLSLTGGGDKEVTAVVTIKEGMDFTMMWAVPQTPKFTMEYSESSILDRVDYDLYGYSFEVKDPIESGWRQFVEYTDDTPAPSGCDGYLNPKFEGFVTQFGGDSDRGEDQTVIRGHSGRVYLPGEQLIAVYESYRAVTDWVEVDKSQEPHVIEGIGPYRGQIEFERSQEYTFRVRAIYKASSILKDGSVFDSLVYANSAGESSDYWVKQSYTHLGGVYKSQNLDFSSTPLTIDGTVHNAFSDDDAWVSIVPEQEPFPDE